MKVRLVVTALVLRLLSRLNARWAARWLDFAFWQAPLRYPEPEREREWRRVAPPLTISTMGKNLVGYRWGEGPMVLLVHGWSGRGLQFGAMAQSLVSAGYRVIAFDAPAHGRSPGHHTNFPKISNVIEQIAHAHGPLHAMVAHSGGCTPAAMVAGRMNARFRFVCVSPLASLRSGLRDLHARLKVTPDVARAHERRQIERYGADVFEKYSLEYLVRELATPGLIVHDVEDDEVPISEAHTLAQRWPGAALTVTRGLGHYRLLRDPATIDAIVQFVGKP
jgi:pimeloyl-ACP methyl ester carboxylesterase